MYSNGNINHLFMIYTVLVVLKFHCTGIHILHGRVNIMYYCSFVVRFALSSIVGRGN